MQENYFFACVSNALNLLYTDGLYKWFKRVRGLAATQANYLFTRTKVVFIVLILFLLLQAIVFQSVYTPYQVISGTLVLGRKCFFF